MAIKRRDPAWVPPAYEMRDLDALRALANGEADPHQQIVALDWIVKHAAGTYDLSFRSAADGGDRDTAFAEGRRFVGLQIVKIVTLAKPVVAAMRKVEAEKRGPQNG